MQLVTLTQRHLTRTQTFFFFRISLLRYNFHTKNVPILNIQCSQFSLVAQSCPTLRPHELQHNRFPCPSPAPGACTNSVSIQSVMPSKHLILCCPYLLLPSVFPSIGVCSNESSRHIRWPNYQSFRCIVSPSNEQSGFVSFRIDWLDLLAVQRTLKSLLQHHSSKASVLRCSTF